MKNRVRRPNRRAAITLCAVTVAGALLSTGCSSGKGSGNPVIMGTTDEVTSVDPAAGYNPGSWIVFSNVFQSLLKFSPGSTTPEPDAAKKCGFTDGTSRVYECTLQAGLEFSNGNELTSRDVAHSFERTLRIRDPDGPIPLLSTIDRIDTPTDDRVVFHLNQSDASFPLKIASSAGSIVDHRVYPAGRLRTDGQAVGSGVYTLASYEPKRQAVFAVNDDYQGSAEARNTGMTMTLFSDQQELKKALQTGDVDLAYRGLTVSDIAALQTSLDNTVKVVEGTGAEVQHLVFNLKDPVVGETAVRQAVAYVLDRQKMVRDVYKRTADPLYSMVPAGIIGHTTAFFNAYGEPDPDRARELLRDAGLTEKVRFTLWATPIRYGPGTVAEVQEIARQLNASGLFQVSVKTTDAEQYAQDVERGKYAAYIKGWVPDYPDPDNFTAPFFGPGNVLSNGYTNARITEELIPETSAIPDRMDTLSRFKELQDLVAEDVPLLPLWQGKQYIVARDGVRGLESTLDASTVFRFWVIEKTSAS